MSPVKLEGENLFPISSAIELTSHVWSPNRLTTTLWFHADWWKLDINTEELLCADFRGRAEEYWKWMADFISFVHSDFDLMNFLHHLK